MPKAEITTLVDTIAQDILEHNIGDCTSEDKVEMCEICAVVIKLANNINKLKTETCIYCPTTAPEYECPICRERHTGMSHIQMLFLHSHARPYEMDLWSRGHEFSIRYQHRLSHTIVLNNVVISCNPHIKGKKLPSMDISANGDINIDTVNNTTGGIGKVKIPLIGRLW